MIAASIMTLDENKTHWSVLYHSMDFIEVRALIKQYTDEYYPGIPFSIHLTRSDGVIDRDVLIIKYPNGCQDEI